MRSGEAHNHFLRAGLAHRNLVDPKELCSSFLSLYPMIPAGLMPLIWVPWIKANCPLLSAIGGAIVGAVDPRAVIEETTKTLNSSGTVVEKYRIDAALDLIGVSREWPQERSEISVVESISRYGFKGSELDEIVDIALASADISVEISTADRRWSRSLGHDAAGAMLCWGLGPGSAIIGAAAFSILL
jgi:hypothetical protein